MSLYATPVCSRRIGKWVLDLFGDKGGWRPICKARSSSHPAVITSYMVTPGTTSSIFMAARPICSANGVSAELATARRISGYCPACTSWSACKAPGYNLMVWRPLMTPTTPSPASPKGPRTVFDGICARVYISGDHMHSSKSNTTILGSGLKGVASVSLAVA